MKPTIPEVAPLVLALYRREGGCAGCCLHIVLDDTNVKDSDVAFCLRQAQERGHEDCIALALKLVEMSKTQRFKLSHWSLYCKMRKVEVAG
jgi:hypothetical protein